jgi:hypothetical protein
MDDIYQQLLRDMEIALESFISKVPPAQRVPFARSFVFRYVEQTAEQAIVQKLARIITGLRAALLLVRSGLVQEQSVIERVLDELFEDVLFLVLGIAEGELGLKHKRFLENFYQEEFNIPENPLNSDQKRPMIKRKEIQAYNAAAGTVGNPSLNQQVARTVSKAFSGFVHAASPQIMEMYSDSPPQFYVYGMLGTPRMEAANREIWNYFYRGITAFMIVASRVLIDGELLAHLASQREKFEAVTGKIYEQYRGNRQIT